MALRAEQLNERAALSGERYQPDTNSLSRQKLRRCRINAASQLRASSTGLYMTRSRSPVIVRALGSSYPAFCEELWQPKANHKSAR